MLPADPVQAVSAAVRAAEIEARLEQPRQRRPSRLRRPERLQGLGLNAANDAANEFPVAVGERRSCCPRRRGLDQVGRRTRSPLKARISAHNRVGSRRNRPASHQLNRPVKVAANKPLTTRRPLTQPPNRGGTLSERTRLRGDQPLRTDIAMRRTRTQLKRCRCHATSSEDLPGKRKGSASSVTGRAFPLRWP